MHDQFHRFIRVLYRDVDPNVCGIVIEGCYVCDIHDVFLSVTRLRMVSWFIHEVIVPVL